jgi:hypothetical protein
MDPIERAQMPHYKCGACRARLQIAQPPPSPIVVLCPECRSALDRVADLSELIGLKQIPFADDGVGAGDDASGSYDGPASAAIALPLPRPSG